MSNNYTQIPIINRMSMILDLILETPNGLRTNDFLHRMEIPKTTLYRLLTSMVKNGILSFSPESGIYSLGFKFQAAYTCIDERASHIRESAMPHLNYLARQARETVKLSVLSGLQSYTIASVEGNRPLRISIDTGALFPLHAGAAGKILMCSLDEEIVERYYLQYGASYTDNTIIDVDEMKEELRKIRASGFAIDKGEYMTEIHAVAAPIKNPVGAIIAAVSVAYPVSNLDNLDTRELANQVMQTAYAISLSYNERETRSQPAKLVNTHNAISHI